MINSRNKGRRGQSEAALLLRERDWRVDDTRCGIKSDDLIATDPDGRSWSVEVKKTRTIVPGHIDQARRQAKKRKMPWMLLNRIHGSVCWLVRRQGMWPVVWASDAYKNQAR